MARAFHAGSTVTVAWRPLPLGAKSTRFGEVPVEDVLGERLRVVRVLDDLDLLLQHPFQAVDEDAARTDRLVDLAGVDQEDELLLRLEAVPDAGPGALLEEADVADRLVVERDLGHGEKRFRSRRGVRSRG